MLFLKVGKFILMVEKLLIENRKKRIADCFVCFIFIFFVVVIVVFIVLSLLLCGSVKLIKNSGIFNGEEAVNNDGGIDGLVVLVVLIVIVLVVVIFVVSLFVFVIAFVIVVGIVVSNVVVFTFE